MSFADELHKKAQEGRDQRDQREKAERKAKVDQEMELVKAKFRKAEEICGRIKELAAEAAVDGKNSVELVRSEEYKYQVFMNRDDLEPLDQEVYDGICREGLTPKIEITHGRAVGSAIVSILATWE